MMVRPKKAAARAKANVPPRTPAEPYTFPSPTRGWVLNENLAQPGPGGASILDNWICTTKGIRVRGGSAKRANLGASVTAAFTYKSGITETFFAATPGAIFDITTVVDPEVTPVADVSGQSSGAYSTQQFGTAGGEYLIAVNGADDMQIFDGAAWAAINGASSPAITGENTSDLSQVWSYANRVFFVKKNTMSAFYLPVDSIGGALSEFSLGGIFKKGGSLLFGATWSLDAGDGLDDKCVFVSTEGEVAIYEGTNPGSAADWSKVGVYDITIPLGFNATMQAGGDLLIATRVGLVPLSEAINKDIAALEMSAVSARITPYWQGQAGPLSGDWDIMKWPERNIMVVSQPDTANGACLVANLQTGAWSRVTGWDTQCLAYYQGEGFFGAADGYVYQMDVTGADSGAIYTATYLGLHEGLAAPGFEKTVLQMRAIFETATQINPQLTATTDFSSIVSAPPNAPTGSETDGWDISVWDTSLWDANSAIVVSGNWVAVGRTGRTIAPELQLTFGNVTKPVVELVAIDATYEIGGMVT